MTPRKLLYAFPCDCNLQMTITQRNLLEVFGCVRPLIARSFRRSIAICLSAISEDYLGVSNVNFVLRD